MNTAPAPATTAAGLTTTQGSALYIAAVLGPGILVIPAAAVNAAGPSALIVLAGLTAVSVAIAFTFARLGAALPDSGGITALTLRAFGSRAARMSAWVFFFGVPIGVPALVLFGAGYLQSVAGGGRTTTFVVAMGLLAICVLINWFGVKASSQVQILLCAVLAVAVIAIALIALPGSHPSTFSHPVTHGFPGIATAAVLLVWSLTGWEAGTYLAGDFARPHRDITRATTVAVIVVSTTYLLLTLVFALNTEAAAAQAPLLNLLTTHLAAASAGVLVTALAVVVTIGGTNVYLASLARFGATAARDGYLSAWLASPSRRGDGRPLLTVSAISAAGLLGWWQFDWEATTLAAACAAAQIAVYLFGLASARRLLTTARTGATIALVVVAGVLALCGSYLLVPALIAATAALPRRTAAPVPGQNVSHSTDPASNLPVNH